MSPKDAPRGTAASSEIAELRREIAALHAENEALARSLGPRGEAIRTRALPPSADPTRSPEASSGGYREPDREALAARTLADLQSALVSERMDNNTLRAMRDRTSGAPLQLSPRLWLGLRVGVVSLGFGAFVLAVLWGELTTFVLAGIPLTIVLLGLSDRNGSGGSGGEGGGSGGGSGDFPNHPQPWHWLTGGRQ
ncbi:MAG: hypothetical protein R3B70_38640 [Polyangiaceae bacterium]